MADAIGDIVIIADGATPESNFPWWVVATGAMGVGLLAVVATRRKKK